MTSFRMQHLLVGPPSRTGAYARVGVEATRLIQRAVGLLDEARRRLEDGASVVRKAKDVTPYRVLAALSTSCATAQLVVDRFGCTAAACVADMDTSNALVDPSPIFLFAEAIAAAKVAPRTSQTEFPVPAGAARLATPAEYKAAVKAARRLMPRAHEGLVEAANGLAAFGAGPTAATQNSVTQWRLDDERLVAALAAPAVAYAAQVVHAWALTPLETVQDVPIALAAAYVQAWDGTVRQHPVDFR